MQPRKKTTLLSSEVKKMGRRNLVKLALFGGGAFILGKLFGTITDMFSDPVIKDVEFTNFKFVESQKRLTISDKSGEPILIVDKDSY